MTSPKSLKMALATSILALSAASASAADVELNVVSWGGAYTRSQINAYEKPYMAEHPEVQRLRGPDRAERLHRAR